MTEALEKHVAVSQPASSLEEHTKIDEDTQGINQHEDEYPSGLRLAAVIASLMLGMFLVALDNVSPIHVHQDLS